MSLPVFPPRLILGSASPRRAALLRQLGLPFEQIASPREELLPDGYRPREFVLASARCKAQAVYSLLQEGEAGSRPFIVIGADTVVSLGRVILGKPANPEEAAAMLQALAGRTHRVYTALCLIRDTGDEVCDCAMTRVRMRPLSPADIQAYVASGEPLDKAGAYGIQGLGACFIEQIEGCYYNVVGLPLARLSVLLEAAGYPFSLYARKSGR